MTTYRRTINHHPPANKLLMIKSRRGGCACGGYFETECYYDGTQFVGIRNQDWVEYWKIHPDDATMDEAIKKSVCPIGCENCIE